jgi:hypothetical protein
MAGFEMMHGLVWCSHIVTSVLKENIPESTPDGIPMYRPPAGISNTYTYVPATS